MNLCINLSDILNEINIKIESVKYTIQKFLSAAVLDLNGSTCVEEDSKA